VTTNNRREPNIDSKKISTNEKKIRIMVVDDHFVVRIGLAGSINIEPDMVIEIEVFYRPACR